MTYDQSQELFPKPLLTEIQLGTLREHDRVLVYTEKYLRIFVIKDGTLLGRRRADYYRQPIMPGGEEGEWEHQGEVLLVGSAESYYKLPYGETTRNEFLGVTHALVRGRYALFQQPPFERAEELTPASQLITWPTEQIMKLELTRFGQLGIDDWESGKR